MQVIVFDSSGAAIFPNHFDYFLDYRDQLSEIHLMFFFPSLYFQGEIFNQSALKYTTFVVGSYEIWCLRYP